MYQFERDTKGNIIKEIGFDEMERTFERSLAGLVQRIFNAQMIVGQRISMMI